MTRYVLINRHWYRFISNMVNTSVVCVCHSETQIFT